MMQGGGQDGTLIDGMEQVLFDDDENPYVANIMVTEFHLKFCTVRETKHKKPILNDRRTISFSNIISIQHVPNTKKKYLSETIKTLTFEIKDAHFTRLFLSSTNANETTKKQENNNDCAVDIITCGFSRLHMQIMSLWHAQRMRASLCIDDKYGHTDHDLAQEYYIETLASLREVSKNGDSLAEKVEILNEFADEVASDIELKMICFKSKELLMILFKMYDSILQPDDDMLFMNQKANAITSRKSKVAANTKIEEMIFEKLLLFHAIVRVMHSILVSTQSIPSRFEVFSWTSAPFNLATWTDLFVRDVHDDLCSMLQYKHSNLDETELNIELNKSFENISLSTPKRKKAAYGGEGKFFLTNKITNVFSEEHLTPLRQRVEKHFALYGVDYKSKIGLLVRSIKDIQTMLATLCVDLCVTGEQAYHINGSTVYPPPKLRITEHIVRHEGWEAFVEDVMIRISHILDDMLSMDSVVEVVQKRLYDINPMSRPRVRTVSDLSCPSPVSTPSRRLERGYSFDNVSTPRGIHVVDRMRMPPSPQHKARKFVTKKPSFRDLTSDPAENVNTMFETQEVMLHCACYLIRMLVLDNSKVRSFLAHEIDNHWFGIMHSMNLIFPRPEPVREDEKSDKDNPEPKTSFFKGCLPGKNKSNKSDSSVVTADVNKDSDDETVADTVKLKKQVATVNLHEYGPPLYSHLSLASWELCILARGAIENCIGQLELGISFYHHIVEENEESKQNNSEAKATTRSLQRRLNAKDTSTLPDEPLGVLLEKHPTRSTSMFKEYDPHDVTVPLLAPPKRINDSFESDLPNFGNAASSSKSRLAARYRKKQI